MNNRIARSMIALFAAATMSFATAACSDDEDDSVDIETELDEGVDDLEQEVDDGADEVEEEIEEGGDEMEEEMEDEG